VVRVIHLAWKWWLALMLALLVSLGAGETEAGYRGSFEGWIVDAETKEPVEGVVVLIAWVQARISGRRALDAAETVTDAKGHFFIPTWWSLNPWRNFTTEGFVTIFKSGYEPIGYGAWDDLLDIEWGAPKGTYIWKVEKTGRPMLLLRRVTDVQQRDMDIGTVDPGGDVPEEKKELLRNEIDKEYEIIRLCKRTGRC